MIPNRTILVGDVLEKIKEVPDESIDCIITSPPYWRLRDYGVKGQWGAEADFREYLKKLQTLMSEHKRVLKKTGTCWVNLGDTYNGTGDHIKDKDFGKQDLVKGTDHLRIKGRQIKGIQKKSRFAIPERFYVACIDDGWIARNHIVWYKENTMPSSVTDRLSNKWESIFFFAKSSRYHFDLNAIREMPKTGISSQTKTPPNHIQTPLFDSIPIPAKQINRSIALNANGKPFFFETKANRITYAHKVLGYDSKNYLSHPLGKNPGDVFSINVRPFTGPHPAVFPIELPLKILKAACPRGGMVLDPFFGAGTVGVAAEELGLNWVGIELNPKFVELAKKRLKSHMNEKLNVPVI